MRSTREGYICPHRIVDDVGSGFSLGLILGGMWNFLKGTYSSPAKERLWGGVMLTKRRAPITGGNFAAWMGLFGFWQCAFLYMTGKDTHMNQVMAGALTGGMVNMRGGMHYMVRGFTSGAIFIGVFNIIEILMNKSMFKTEIMKRHVQMRIQNLTEINKYRKIRPDLINVSDDEFEIMKNELNNDVQKFKFYEFYPYMQQADLLN